MPEERGAATAAVHGAQRWRLSRLFLELAALAALSIVAVGQGKEALSNWHGPGGSVTTELYIPAIGMAAGHGFVNVVPDSVPELRRFLNFQTSAFDPALLQSGREQPLHSYQEYHRYLVASVGWLWSLFGVSWNVVKWMLIALLAICLWEVYGISRLAMGMPAAFLVAFSFSKCHPLLGALANLRDFSKAPFILGVILLLACLIRRPRGPRTLLAVAITTGAVLGIGLGFRRDAMVVVPFAVLVLACAPARLPWLGRGLFLRIGAIGIMVTVFCLSAWPILKAFHEHGTLAAHDTIMGFSTNSDREMTLDLASYEKLYVQNDLYCSMAAYDAGRRGVTGDPGEYRRHCTEYEYDDILKKRYVLAMLQRFPADMITRAFGACIRILRGIWGVSDPWLTPFMPDGIWLALIALVGVSMVNWRLATAMLAFVLFFAGYTSGQFSSRHAFHLEFAPLFFGWFLIDRAFRIAVGTIRHRRGLWRCPWRQCFLKPIQRILQACLWLLCMGLPLWAVLALAGIWQDRQVDRIVDRIVRAEKTPVPHSMGQWDDRVLFAPNNPDGCLECQNEGLLVDFRTTVYLVRIAAGSDDPDLRLCYDVPDFGRDFSRPVRMDMTPGMPCDLWYCFPVFEPTMCALWSRFAGVSMPAEQANRFHGFCRVNRPEDLDLLVNVVIPDDPQRFLRRQQVPLPWKGNVTQTFFLQPIGDEIFSVMAQAAGEGAAGNWLDALAGWNAAVACRPQSICANMGRAQALDRLNRPEETLGALESLLAGLPDEGRACGIVHRYLTETRPPVSVTATWRELASRLPNDPCIHRYAEEYLPN